MKKFIMGFLTAALLFTALPVGAAIEEYICHKADYKVMVNGAEYANPDLPVLNYEGNTYAPFRPILEAAGLNVNWNAELKQAEVTVPEGDLMKRGDNVSEAKIEYDTVSGLPVGAEYVEKELNSKTYKAILYNGKEYISTSDLRGLFEVKATTLDVKTGIQNFVKDAVVVGVDVNVALFVGSYVYYDISLFDDLLK